MTFARASIMQMQIAALSSISFWNFTREESAFSVSRRSVMSSPEARTPVMFPRSSFSSVLRQAMRRSFPAFVTIALSKIPFPSIFSGLNLMKEALTDSRSRAGSRTSNQFRPTSTARRSIANLLPFSRLIIATR